MLVLMTATMLLLAAFPTTRIGEGLHRLLVETPARRLNALSPGRIAFYAALGAAGLVLFGTVAASGIRTLAKVDYNQNMNLIIVATSIGVGLLPIVAPQFYHHFPEWFATIFHSGISATAMMAVILNLLFNHFKQGNAEQPSVFEAGSSRVLSEAVLAALADGDRVEGGKVYDKDGKEVPVACAKVSAH